MKTLHITSDINTTGSESHGISRLQMAIAFFSGVFVAAAMALIPATADLFYSGTSCESVVPANHNIPHSPNPDSIPGANEPDKPGFIELIFNFNNKDFTPC